MSTDREMETDAEAETDPDMEDVESVRGTGPGLARRLPPSHRTSTRRP